MRTLYKLSETVFAIHFRHGRVTEENVRAELPRSLVMLAEQNGYAITFKQEEIGEAGKYRATSEPMCRAFPKEVAELKRICSDPNGYILVRLKPAPPPNYLADDLNWSPSVKLGNRNWSPDCGGGRQRKRHEGR